jgi:pre-mRNA-processing factor 40
MLEEHVTDGTITAKTRWRDYCSQIKDSQAYLAVASNTSGSTPKELFDDVIEELDKQYLDDKTRVKEVVKSGKIPMTTSWKLEEFQTAILDDDALKGISTINIKLIYDDQIERLKEKEQKDAKKRQRLGENFSDLLYSITVLQLTISMLHYLLTCKLSALIYSVWSTAVTKCLEELL